MKRLLFILAASGLSVPVASILAGAPAPHGVATKGVPAISYEYAEVQALNLTGACPPPTSPPPQGLRTGSALPVPFSGSCGYDVTLCASLADGGVVLPDAGYAGTLQAAGTVHICTWDTGPAGKGAWVETPQLAETVTVNGAPCQRFAAHASPGYSSLWVEPQVSGVTVDGGATNVAVIVGVSKCAL